MYCLIELLERFSEIQKNLEQSYDQVGTERAFVEGAISSLKGPKNNIHN